MHLTLQRLNGRRKACLFYIFLTCCIHHFYVCDAVTPVKVPPPQAKALSKETIYHAVPEVLLTPGLVRKESSTLDKCAKACLEEKTIKCQFFKFVNSSKTCFLSESDHPSVRKLVNEAIGPGHQNGIDLNNNKGPGPGPGKNGPKKTALPKDKNNGARKKVIKTLNKKFDSIQKKIHMLDNVKHRLENMKKKGRKKDDEIADLWKSQLKQQDSIAFLKKIMLLLAKKAKSIKNELSDVKNSQQDLHRNVKQLKLSTMHLGKGVHTLGNVSLGIKKNLQKLDRFKAVVRNRVIEEERYSKNLGRKMDRIRTFLNKNRYNGVNTKSQKRLTEEQLKMAKAIEKVSNKGYNISNRVHSLMEEMSSIMQQIKDTNVGQKNEEVEVQKMGESLQRLQNEIAGLEDPTSPNNRKWQSQIGNMKALIVRLTDSNNRLVGEMKSSKQDLAGILKDLTNVQLASQDMKIKLESVKHTTSQLQNDVAELEKAKVQTPNIVQLTRMGTTVLRSLTGIERKEQIMAEKVDDFEKLVKKLEHDVHDRSQKNSAEKRYLHHLTEKVKSVESHLSDISRSMRKLSLGPSAQTADVHSLKQKQMKVIKVLRKMWSGMSMMMKQLVKLKHQSQNTATNEKIASVQRQLKASVTKLSQYIRYLKNKDLQMTHNFVFMKSQLHRLKGAMNGMNNQIHTVQDNQKVATISISKASGCPKGSQSTRAGNCLTVFSSAQPWYVARRHCQKQKSQLYTQSQDQENELFNYLKNLKKTGNFWISDIVFRWKYRKWIWGTTYKPLEKQPKIPYKGRKHRYCIFGNYDGKKFTWHHKLCKQLGRWKTNYYVCQKANTGFKKPKTKPQIKPPTKPTRPQITIPKVKTKPPAIKAASCPHGAQTTKAGNCLAAFHSAQPWYVARRNCQKLRSQLYTQSPNQDNDLYSYLRALKKKGKFWVSQIIYRWNVKKWISESTKQPLEVQPRLPYRERKHRMCIFGSFDGKNVKWYQKRCRSLGQWKANYYICETAIKGFKKPVKPKTQKKVKVVKVKPISKTWKPKVKVTKTGKQGHKKAASCPHGAKQTNAGNCLAAFHSAQPWYVARRNCQKLKSQLYTQSPHQDNDLYSYLRGLKKKGKFWVSQIIYRWNVKKWISESTKQPLEVQPRLPYRERKHRMCIFGSFDGKNVKWYQKRCRSLGQWKANYYICETAIKGFKKPVQPKTQKKVKVVKVTKPGKTSGKKAASCTGGSQLSSVGNCLIAYSSAQPWYVARRNCYKKRSKLYTQSPSQDKDLYNYLKKFNKKGNFWISQIVFRWNIRKWIWGTTKQPLEVQPQIHYKERRFRYCLYVNYDGRKFRWFKKRCKSLRTWKADNYICQSALKGFKKISLTKTINKLKKLKVTEKEPTGKQKGTTCSSGSTLSNTGNCLTAFYSAQAWYKARQNCQRMKSQLYEKSPSQDKDLMKYLKKLNKKGRFWISSMFFNWKVRKWVWSSTRKPLEQQPSLPYTQRRHRYCTFGNYDGKKIQWYAKPCKKFGGWKVNSYICQAFIKGYKKALEAQKKAESCPNGSKLSRSGNCLTAYSDAQPWYAAKSICRKKKSKLYMSNGGQDNDLNDYLKKANKRGKFWSSQIVFRWNLRKWIWESTKQPLDQQPRIPYRGRKHRYCVFGTFNGNKVQWYYRPCKMLGKWRVNFYVCQSAVKGFKPSTSQAVQQKGASDGCQSNAKLSRAGNCLTAVSDGQPWYVAKKNCRRQKSKLYTQNGGQDNDLNNYLKIFKKKGRFWASPIIFRWNLRKWVWEATKQPMDVQPRIPYRGRKHRYCVFGSFYGNGVRWIYRPCNRMGKWKANFYVCQSILKGFKKTKSKG